MNFDEIYSTNTMYFSQEHSGGMEECLKKYQVKACRAVDIGAGEGRNSLFLASVGFDVTAVEPSVVGANKIAERAGAAKLHVNLVNSDFLSAAASLHDVEFIVALTSLEHMEYDYLCRAVDEIKRILAPGGYLYIMVFTEDDPGYKKDLENASECALFIKHYFKKGELKQFFSDFEILEYAEYTKEDTTHGPVHYHGKAKLFGRKPQAKNVRVTTGE